MSSTVNPVTETLDIVERALFVNESFYLAFSRKDVDEMDGLWAREHPVTCVHPGWPALTERDDIMKYWRMILENPGQSGIDFHEPTARRVGDTVLVTCYEELPDSVCVATNGFIAEGDAVKMFLHHAGPCAMPPGEEG